MPGEVAIALVQHASRPVLVVPTSKAAAERRKAAERDQRSREATPVGPRRAHARRAPRGPPCAAPRRSGPGPSCRAPEAPRELVASELAVLGQHRARSGRARGRARDPRRCAGGRSPRRSRACPASGTCRRSRGPVADGARDRRPAGGRSARAAAPRPPARPRALPAARRRPPRPSAAWRCPRAPSARRARPSDSSASPPSAIAPAPIRKPVATCSGLPLWMNCPNRYGPEMPPMAVPTA